MDVGVYSLDEVTNEQIKAKIKAHESFTIKEIETLKFFNAVEVIEKMIESLGMKCRVYSTYRTTLMLTAAIPNPITAALGIGTAIGVAAHNLATWGPDYEIGKNMTLGTLDIIYKK